MNLNRMKEVAEIVTLFRRNLYGHGHSETAIREINETSEQTHNKSGLVKIISLSVSYSNHYLKKI